MIAYIQEHCSVEIFSYVGREGGGYEGYKAMQLCSYAAMLAVLAVLAMS
jgi:hypothetical protein